MYSGDENYEGSESDPLVQTVKGRATTTGIDVTPNPIEVGKPVTLTAVVTDNTKFTTPSGTVTFTVDGNALPSMPLSPSGVAITTVSTIGVGDHAIAAAYGGSDTHEGSTSATVTLKVLPASTATTLTPSVAEGEIPFSAPLQVTIAVADGAGAPGAGTVELLEGSATKTVIATADLANGAATIPVPQLSVGEHFLSARFVGSTSLAPSDSTARYYNVIAAESATTLALSTDHAAPGDPVVLTATVTPVAPATGLPAGTVTFRRGGVILGTVPLTAGSALFNVALPYGTYSLTASYDASPEFKGSKSAETALAVDRKVGPEQIVNTTTKGVQSTPAVSPGTTGGGLVVWADAAKAGATKAAIRGRVIGIGGVPVGQDVVIAKAAEGVAAPMVSGFASGPGTGDYAVVWQAGKAGDSDVYLQIVTAAGKPKGAASVVHADKAGDQTAPVVMPYDDKGDFLVAWQSTADDTDGSDIFAQRFDKAGKAKGKLIKVNATTKGDQVRPVATPLTTGGFAIGWSGPLKSGHGAFVQYYTKTGKAKGKAFTVDTVPTSASPRLALMIGEKAGIVASWDEPDKKGSAARNAYAAVFSSTGKRLGPIVQLDKTKKGDQSQPTMMPVLGPVSGLRLATAWSAPDADGAGISLSLFSPTAARDGAIEPANTTTKGAQTAPMLAGIFSGTPAASYFLAVWATTQADAGDIALQVFQLK